MNDSDGGNVTAADIATDDNATSAPRPVYATQFARDLAEALTDPVVIALLTHVVGEALTRHDAQVRARMADDARPVQHEPTNIDRASNRTAWVGRALQRQQAQQQVVVADATESAASS